MTEPSAKIILDSISPSGHRLTTMEVVMHRFVLAEFNTHRMFSRNSASSRAIPVKKQLQRVMEDPALPLSWPSEKPGMQGGEQQSLSARARSHQIWLEARDAAVHAVMALTNAMRDSENELVEPLHKSVANRLLEPFMWHTVIVSSTAWGNFFGLRCNPMAQPEIQAAAYAMRDAYEGSSPTILEHGQWHLPYVSVDEKLTMNYETLGKISAARCARVSYLTHDGIKSHEADLKLFNQLTSADPPHSSPLEHVATPATVGDTGAGDVSGNFRGWHQLRHMTDTPRPTKEGREGESQAMPVVNDSQDIQSMVIADIEERRRVGISRYGTALQPFNGRDALLDLYEELMDATIYLKQCLVEESVTHA